LYSPFQKEISIGTICSNNKCIILWGVFATEMENKQKRRVQPLRPYFFASTSLDVFVDAALILAN
jgi:hypothetical protein